MTASSLKACLVSKSAGSKLIGYADIWRQLSALLLTPVYHRRWTDRERRLAGASRSLFRYS